MKSDYELHICGEITWDVADRVVNEIVHDCIKKKYTKLKLLISSPGGDIDAAWTIYTTLKYSDLKVTTICHGRLYSAGAIPFLAGSKRCVFPNASFLFHPTTIQITANEERARYKVAEELKGFVIDDNFFIELLKTTLTKAKKTDIHKLSHATKSVFINADQALKIGLATHKIQSINKV